MQMAGAFLGKLISFSPSATSAGSMFAQPRIWPLWAPVPYTTMERPRTAQEGKSKSDLQQYTLITSTHSTTPTYIEHAWCFCNRLRYFWAHQWMVPVDVSFRHRRNAIYDFCLSLAPFQAFRASLQDLPLHIASGLVQCSHPSSQIHYLCLLHTGYICQQWDHIVYH